MLAIKGTQQKYLKRKISFELQSATFHTSIPFREGLLYLPLLVMRAWSSVLSGLLFSQAMYFFHSSTCNGTTSQVLLRTLYTS